MMTAPTRSTKAHVTLNMAELVYDGQIWSAKTLIF